MNNLFPDYIGQDRAKSILGFHLENYEKTSIMPNLFLCSQRGDGKTTLATAVASKLINKDTNKPKTFVKINCSTLRGITQFFTTVILKYVHDRDVTVLFDEASEIPKDITMALLTVLEPTSSHKTQFKLNDMVFDFDFRRVSFMFCTTESQNVFHALRNRLERIDLASYTREELQKISALSLKEFKIQDGLMERVSDCFRGDGRDAHLIGEKIKGYVNRTKKKEFTFNDWDTIKSRLGILPLGLNPKEVEILNVLKDGTECSLTRMSARLGLTQECLRKDYELFILKNGLMEIKQRGRVITPKGREYLTQNKL